MGPENFGAFRADRAIAKRGAFGRAGYNPDMLWHEAILEESSPALRYYSCDLNSGVEYR